MLSFTRHLSQTGLRQATFNIPIARTAWRDLRSYATEVQPAFETIAVDVRDKFAILLLNRPKALNALSTQVMHEVTRALAMLDADDRVKSIIITGAGEKAFAAGADIKEMSTKDYAQVYKGMLFNPWDRVTEVKKPIIAAVNGYALGGGCELAMMCDIVLASEKAIFGQPEVALGVIPGLGGTQRLTRAIGKSRAMELVLTGARLTAHEAERLGLVSRVVPADRLMEEAIAVAVKIATYSSPVVAKAKACVNAAYELSLAEGLRSERREFWSCFALQDQKEGMNAFVEKRDAKFQDR